MIPHSFIFFISISLLFSISSSKPPNYLNSGSSLSVEHHDSDSNRLMSPDKTFTCGFYTLGENAFWFSIWFTRSINKTLVWTANRDKPVNGKGSKLSIRRDGIMLLTDVDGSIIWQSNTTSSNNVKKAELLDSGNLVLKNTNGKILWQSFDFPTDTLLPNQDFGKSQKLISSYGKGYFSSGYFNFLFDNDNVLRLKYDGPEITSLYYPNPDKTIFQNGRTNYNSSRVAKLDDLGVFLSSDNMSFVASDMGVGIKRRLTLDYDGNLRLYSLNKSLGLWLITWKALSQTCNVHGVCGRNGICVYAPGPMCSCPPGYEMKNPSNWNDGCKPKFESLCSNPKSQKYKFVELYNTDYYGFDLEFRPTISLHACRQLCLDSCLCEAFSYRLKGERPCFTKSALFNGYKSPRFPGTIYLKLPEIFNTTAPSSLNVSNPVCASGEAARVVIGPPNMYDISNKSVKWSYFYWFALAIGAFEIFCAVIGWWFLYRKHGLPASVEDGYRATSSQFRRFTYTELKKATNNFKNEIGKGGSGVVYKGVLTDKREVGVKKLGSDVIQGYDLFWAEVSTIGKIYHMNLVRMWGFCSERRHKLLVYEYVENLSLDTHLFSNNSLDWKKRFEIAIGAAKGLAYLHHECLEWVIHCDVKPENILLDGEFTPKIADFGLAKLSQRGGPGSEFSRIRGTKGYMAPEWALNLPITAKVDVYSYGVVLLELVKGIRLSNWVLRGGDDEDDSVEEVELTRFIRVVKKKLHQKQEDGWIDDIVDPRLEGKFSRNQVLTMVVIGISCVEEDRNKRPTMDTVVQRLLEWQDEALVDEALVDEALVDEALVDEALVDEALVDEALVDEALVDEALVDEALVHHS